MTSPRKNILGMCRTWWRCTIVILLVAILIYTSLLTETIIDVDKILHLPAHNEDGNKALVFDSTNTLLTYQEYREKVYRKITRCRNDSVCTQDGRTWWSRLTTDQKWMLLHTGFSETNDWEDLGNADFEMKEIKPLADYKNPCWWDTDGVTSFRTSRLLCLPYFMMIGTSKCGSTDVYYQLRKHRQIRFSNPKEPHWWSQRRTGVLQARRSSWENLSQYLRFFTTPTLDIHRERNRTGYHSLIMGEASADTLFRMDRWPLLPGNEGRGQPAVITAHHLHTLLPAVKLITLVRNPVDRFYSNYNEVHRARGSAWDFHELTLLHLAAMKACLANRTTRECAYDPRVPLQPNMRLQAGLYGIFLADWLAVFPRSQVRVYTLEEYKDSRKTVLNDITDFLQIPRFQEDAMEFISGSAVRNAKPREPMLPETRQILTEFYRPYNKMFAQMMNDTKFDYFS